MLVSRASRTKGAQHRAVESTDSSLDVLVVEDDAPLREVLTLHLAAEGWAVRAAGSGDVALAACEAKLPDIVVLDVMLPGRSGVQVCAALRALYDPSPGVVMLTARESELDVVLGFEAGADDYVIKPCRPRVLVARIKALARRVRQTGSPSVPPPRDGTSPDDVVVLGKLRIEEQRRSVTVAGAPVKLTQTELALLLVLARSPDRVHSRMELLQKIWDSDHEGYARNVDCHVTRLRRKLENAGLSPALIETVHGVGYCLVTPAEAR